MKIENMNEGVIFQNDKDHDKQPDMTGHLNVFGKQVRIACWTKVSKKTDKNFLSCKISDTDYNKGDVTPQEVYQNKIEDSSMPF